MPQYRTEQEDFWAGEFGTEYIGRNVSEEYVAANTAFFSRIIARMGPVDSVLELGPNVGLNLVAINRLLPQAALTGVEINPDAFEKLQALSYVSAVHQSILDFKPPHRFDLVFTKGVLIHIAPDALPDVYDTMYAASGHYILMSEYYNPTPTQITYRGHESRLFKRDFAGEFMDRHADVELVDYGFVWKRDPHFPQDDMTWFLMRKHG